MICSLDRYGDVLRRAASRNIRFCFARCQVQSLDMVRKGLNRDSSAEKKATAGAKTRPPTKRSIIPVAMSDSKKPQAIAIGPERELQLYAQGLVGGKPSVPVPLHLLEAKAKEILEPRAYDYVAGGAGGEDTMRGNREAFYPRRIVPRMLRGGLKRDLSVRVVCA